MRSAQISTVGEGNLAHGTARVRRSSPVAVTAIGHIASAVTCFTGSGEGVYPAAMVTVVSQGVPQGTAPDERGPCSLAVEIDRYG